MTGTLVTDARTHAVAPISIMLPTYRRTQTLLATVERLQLLRPHPAEIIVHVDGGDDATADALRENFPQVVVLESDQRVGPGGGRNRMLAIASFPLVLSLDDDSYPLDDDFLTRTLTVMDALPDAALVSCAITHRGEPPLAARPVARHSASFIGCGTVYRKAPVLTAGAYVPLPIAYAMEETDLALRVLDKGLVIYSSPWLRVFHDTTLERHADPSINAGVLKNIALHAFLRYPLRAMPYGVAQVLRRVAWSMAHRRYAGLLRGITGIPQYLWRYRHLREAVGIQALRKRRALIAPGNEVEIESSTPEIQRSL